MQSPEYVIDIPINAGDLLKKTTTPSPQVQSVLTLLPAIALEYITMRPRDCAQYCSATWMRAPSLESAWYRLTSPSRSVAGGVSARTLKRWTEGETAVPSNLPFLIRYAIAEQQEAARESRGKFTFVDLFAGIGG